jgi:uncharacterized repeat protein (TIGR01451 family)
MRHFILFQRPGSARWLFCLLFLTTAGLDAWAVGGTVTFANTSSSKVINGQTGNAATTADGLQAALYWAPLGSSTFTQLGAPVVVGNPVSGLFAAGTRTTGPNTIGGSAAQFQVRVWSGGYPNYEQAGQHAGVLLGQSVVLQLITGNPGGEPPLPPNSLIGLNSFTAFTVNSSTYLNLTCASNKTVQCGTAWAFDFPIATSTCADTNLIVNIVSTESNGICPLVVTRTWQANDTCGNSSSCSQAVTVQDDSPPTLFCAGNKTVSCGDPWTFDTPTAVSCTGSNLGVNVLSTVTNTDCPLLVTRTWQSVNLCNGLSNTCSQDITFICTNCVVLQLAKTCPPYPVPPGGTLVFTGSVTNHGRVSMTNLVVVNDRPVPGTVVFGPATLSPGAGASFSGSYTVPSCNCGPFTDTLYAYANGSDGVVYTNAFTSSCAGASYGAPGDLNGDGVVDQNELNAVLSNYWGHSAWLYMSNAVSLGGGVFQFALTNATGWNFTVLVSSNMTDWTNLPNSAYPVYQFFDPAAASNAPSRYYRLRYP